MNKMLAEINVTLQDEKVVPPQSTTWRARTADVGVALHDFGRKCRGIRKLEKPGWNDTIIPWKRSAPTMMFPQLTIRHWRTISCGCWCQTHETAERSRQFHWLLSERKHLAPAEMMFLSGRSRYPFFVDFRRRFENVS